MSLGLIPYQPIVFNLELDECAHCDNEEYCQLVEPDDEIYVQFTQSPCGNNLICDENIIKFSDDMVSNGTFTGSAAGWTLGVAWSYGANKVSFAGGVGHGTLKQTIGTTLVTGKYYALRFTISNVTGILALQPKLGGVLAAAVVAAGSFEQVIVSGGGANELEFVQNINACTFDIDNIELYEIAPCWGAATGWSQSNIGGLHHITGYTSAISPVTPPLTNGIRYYVEFIITDYVGGTVTPRCGTALGDALRGNGYHWDWIISNGTSFSFVPDTDFEGTITFVSVKAMNDDYEVVLSDLGEEIDYMPAISDADYYWDAYATIHLKLSDYQSTYHFADESCFRLTIVDECDDYGSNLVTNGSFAGSYDPWINNANFNYSYHSVFSYKATGSLLIYVFDGDTEIIGTNALPGINDFYYEIKIWGDVDGTTPVTLAVGGRFLGSFDAPGEYSGVVTVADLLSNSVRIGTTGDGVSTADKKIYITDVMVKPITIVEETYISNCINLKPTHDCTKLVVAYAEGAEQSWGFEYLNTGFKLSQRIGLVISQPYYPDEEDDYIYSDGKRSINFATSEKYWRAGTDFLPEEAHDCLRLQRLSDHFIIDDIEYYCKKGSHEPTWKESCQTLAPVRFDIRLKTDPSYNRNG